MNPAEVIAIVKDIAVTIAAVIASWVGLRGLDTWRRQLSGNAKYVLAKSILACVYELRDRIDSVREPAMSYAAEPDLPLEKLEMMSREEKDWQAYAQAYQKRWESIPTAKARLDVNLWECEAVLGKDIVTKVLELNRMVNELYWAIQENLEARNPASRHRQADDPDLYANRRKILFRSHQDDEFKNRVDSVVSEIEGQLRRYVEGRYRS